MSNVEKSIEKFKSHIKKGSVYEAQQYIKTVYHRLRSRKLLEDSRELIKEASCIQLGNNEACPPLDLTFTFTRVFQTCQDQKKLALKYLPRHEEEILVK